MNSTECPIHAPTSAQGHARIQPVKERHRSLAPLLLLRQKLPHVSAARAALDEADEGLFEQDRNINVIYLI